ncbi:MAG: STAS/SEC14 domain-containing protein [Acidiferrobacterales bacterium]
MISIEEDRDLLKVHVMGEFTVSDFKELEDAVTGELQLTPKIKLLIDLTQMSGFTIDMAWEDIKFTREHAHDFQRIAIVSGDQWTTWLSWLNSAFTDAQLQIFADEADASNWALAG